MSSPGSILHSDTLSFQSCFSALLLDVNRKPVKNIYSEESFMMKHRAQNKQEKKKKKNPEKSDNVEIRQKLPIPSAT